MLNPPTSQMNMFTNQDFLDGATYAGRQRLIIA